MRKLRSQEEIMASWKGDPDKPVVSICCITYNHQLYIEGALEGFLNQETDFPFEILINDDASTDHTADIIRKYEANYPKLIKPIFQVKNQYSKGKKINFEFNFPRAKGKYIAFCEGDDYWISTNKLQRQVSVHLRNKNLSLSCHQAIEKNVMDNTEKIIFKVNEEDQLIKPEDIITRKYGYVPTASMMISACHLLELDRFFRHINPPVGDYFIQIFMALHGEVCYLNSITSVYRKNVSASWSKGLQEVESQKNHSWEMVKSLERTWDYLKMNPKARFIGTPWAKYAIGFARHSSSKWYGLLMIFMLSPKLRVSYFNLILDYYFHVISKLLKIRD